MNERERAAVRQAPLLTASSKPLPERLRRKLLVRLVPFVALGYALCFIDRSNISFAELSMRNDTELHLSDADFGLSSGLFFVGYALAQVPALHIAQLVGARYVFTVLLLLWGGVSTSLCLISSTTQLCVLRFLLGLVEAGYYPLMVYYLSTWFPDEWLGAATGFTTMTGISFGLTTRDAHLGRAALLAPPRRPTRLAVVAMALPLAGPADGGRGRPRLPFSPIHRTRRLS